MRCNPKSALTFTSESPFLYKPETLDASKDAVLLAVPIVVETSIEFVPSVTKNGPLEFGPNNP